MPGIPLAVRSQRRTSSPRAIPLWGADRRSHLRLRIQRRILQRRHRHGLPPCPVLRAGDELLLPEGYPARKHPEHRKSQQIQLCSERPDQLL